MSKTAAGLFLIAMAVLGLWFFYHHDNELKFTFQTSTAPGTVFKRILFWDYEHLDNKNIRDTIPFSTIVQELNSSDEKLIAQWKIIPVNDSTTEITASFKAEKEHGINKFGFFNKSLPTKKIKREIALLKEAFKIDESFYNITFKGKETSPGEVCACISLSSKIGQKATFMMASIQDLSDFVAKNNLKMSGKPRIKINSWNIKEDKIEYDFCFPLSNSKGITGNKKISIVEIKPQESLKAIYNGNYMYSNLGWMALLNYAEAKDIKVQKLPLEIFQDNPEMGGDALEWKTVIYLPIKE